MSKNSTFYSTTPKVKQLLKNFNPKSKITIVSESLGQAGHLVGVMSLLRKLTYHLIQGVTINVFVENANPKSKLCVNVGAAL